MNPLGSEENPHINYESAKVGEYVMCELGAALVMKIDDKGVYYLPEPHKKKNQSNIRFRRHEGGE